MRFRGKNQWCISVGTPKAYLENMRTGLAERPAFKSLSDHFAGRIDRMFPVETDVFTSVVSSLYVCEMRRYATRLIDTLGIKILSI